MPHRGDLRVCSASKQEDRSRYRSREEVRWRRRETQRPQRASALDHCSLTREPLLFFPLLNRRKSFKVKPNCKQYRRHSKSNSSILCAQVFYNGFLVFAFVGLVLRTVEQENFIRDLSAVQLVFRVFCTQSSRCDNDTAVSLGGWAYHSCYRYLIRVNSHGSTGRA